MQIHVHQLIHAFWRQCTLTKMETFSALQQKYNVIDTLRAIQNDLASQTLKFDNLQFCDMHILKDHLPLLRVIYSLKQVLAFFLHMQIFVTFSVASLV